MSLNGTAITSAGRAASRPLVTVTTILSAAEALSAAPASRATMDFFMGWESAEKAGADEFATGQVVK